MKKGLPAAARGFTLVELLVSVAIFTVVMVISMGALLAISASDRKAETLKSVMNNLNFALDSMSRAIRTGINYNCGSANGGDCPSSPGGAAIYFLAADGSDVRYRFENFDRVQCNQPIGTVGCIMRSLDGGSTEAPITAPEVVVQNLTFYLIGSSIPDLQQPKVTIILTGYVVVTGTAASQDQCGVTGTCSTFNLQSSVTQRLYDQ